MGQRITSYQLFCLTLLFQLGTTIIFGFGASAGRDAWIATLLSSFLGTLVVVTYVLLMKMNPGLSLVQWFPAQFGKFLGTPISWIYPLIFLFDAGRIGGDLKDLIPTTLLPTTPPIASLLLFLIVMAYVLFQGIDNLARATEILVPFVLILFSIEIILLLSSNILHLKYLFPILFDGVKPIIQTVYPQGICQTYGETIALAMIWTQANNPEKIMKMAIFSSIFSGLLLTCGVILAITALGEHLFIENIYPLFTLLGVVNVGNFINNLDPFGVIYLVTAVFVKMYIKIYAAIVAIQQLTGLQNHRKLIIPAIILVLYLGLTISKNVAEHIYGMAIPVVTPYVWVPLFLIFPALLLVVTWIRTKWLKK